MPELNVYNWKVFFKGFSVVFKVILKQFYGTTWGWEFQLTVIIF